MSNCPATRCSGKPSRRRIVSLAAVLAAALAGCAGTRSTPTGSRDGASADAVGMDLATSWEPGAPPVDGGLVADTGTWPDGAAPDAEAPPDAAGPADLGPPPFDDVSPSSIYATAISWVASQGYMNGCQSAPPRFCPDDPLTRVQAAVSLVRMKFGSSFSYDPSPHFTDVPPTHWGFSFVQKMKDEGITSGCSATEFCPTKPTLRSSAAVFLVRAKHGDSFPYPKTPLFTDVPATHPQFKYIQKLGQMGVTKGCGTGIYCPADATLRAHWAAMLYRIQSL